MRIASAATIESYLPRLRDLPLFVGLREEALRDIAESAEWVHVEADELLYEERAAAETMYIVVEGRMDLWVTREHKELRLDRYYAGEPVGELSILPGRLWPSTVRAVRDSVLLKLSPALYARLADAHGPLPIAMNRVLVARSAKHGPVDAPATAFAITAASHNAPVREVAEQLHKALSIWRTTHLIDSARVDATLGAGAAQAQVGDAQHTTVAKWLADAEGDRNLLVLVADPEDTEWSRRCIRHADTILMVADARERPGAYTPPGRLAGADQGEFDRRELVLVHPPGTGRVRNTRQWLDRVPSDASHHIRAGRAEDMERVARFVTNRAIALAMAGGAARGFAHIGVLKALREANIPIDLVCGTSMGSFVGALCGIDYGLDDMEKLFRGLFVEGNPMDYTLPFVAATRGKKYDAVLLDLFGDTRIEDTWLRYFACSCSINRSALVTHRAGLLRTAVRASSSVPGLFPPVFDGGDVLVDGVFLDNLPAERALQEGAGKVIAVNVLPQANASELAEFGTGGPLHHLKRMLAPSASNRLPPVMQLGIHAMFIGATQSAVRLRSLVDIFIEPDVGNYFFMEWGKFNAISRAGYVATQAAVAAKLEKDPTFVTR